MKKNIMVFVCFFLWVTASSAIGADDWKEHREHWLDKLPGSGASAPKRNDNAENLVDELRFRSLKDMHKLRNGQISGQPWSDFYWPFYMGTIANRYADPQFPASMDWFANQTYLNEQLGRGDLLKFSPAEKYDLLIGDKNFTLTKLMINYGKPYHERENKVATWMGLCDGWAVASFMESRPAKPVEVIGVNGDRILFYPSDIKALTTLLWAKGRFRIRFIGGRCNIQKPERDSNGRPVDPDCLDNNPGTWHLAVVNQIGHSKRSFIFDTTYDLEVWNQPVLSYSYFYLHPKTGKKVNSISSAIFPITSDDPIRHLRAPTAVSLVKILMNVTYLAERPPTTLPDSPRLDMKRFAIYKYELELDDKGEIVGGEWLQEKRPDFLWVPPVGMKAKSVGDYRLDRIRDNSQWELSQPLPQAWKEPAMISSRSSQPLGRIVERLLEFSK